MAEYQKMVDNPVDDLDNVVNEVLEEKPLLTIADLKKARVPKKQTNAERFRARIASEYDNPFTNEGQVRLAMGR
jgi:hypothetical protein